jgi:hypothetical protein
VIETISEQFLRILWFQREEVTCERRKLHNKELYDLYSSDIIKEDEMDVTCSMCGRDEK